MNRLKRLIENEHYLALAALTLCMAFFFRDVVFTGHTFFMMNRTAGTMPLPVGGPFEYPGPPGYTRIADPGALAWVVETYVYHSREALRNFELPLWNPYSGMGNPHVGSGHAGVFDPLAIPVYLAPRSLYPLFSDIEALFRFLMAGFFTYYFLRRIGLGFWAGVSGGAAFMHLDYGLDFGNHSSFKVFIFIPLLLCAYERLLRETSVLNVFTAAGVICWTVVADFGEATFLVLQFATLWFFCEAACRVHAAEPVVRLKEARRMALGLTAAVVLGFALSGPMLLPMLENVTQCDMSYHGDGSGAGSGAWNAGLRILSLIAASGMLWVPHFHPSVLLLALGSPFVTKRLNFGKRTLLFFGLYFVFGFGKVFDFPGTGWIGHLPVYKQIALAKYLPPVLEFCLAVLAALTVESFVRGRPSTRTTTAASILFFAVVGYFIYQQQPSLWDSFETYGRRLTKLAFVAMLPSGLVLCAGMFRLKREWVAMGLLGVIVFDANLAQKGQERPLRCDPYKPPPFVAFLQQQSQPGRIFARDGILYPDIPTAYKLDDIRTITALEPARRKMFIQGLVDPAYTELRFSGTEDGIRYGKFFNLLNTTYVVASLGAAPTDEPAAPFKSSKTPENQPQAKARFEKIYEQDNIKIYRNNNAFPRAFVVHSVEMTGSKDDALIRLGRADFDPAKKVVLEGEWPVGADRNLLASSPAPLATPLPDEAQVVARSLNGMRVRTTLDSPGVLVVSETFFPGWSALVDGKPAPILPADLMLRGVYLDAGAHEIEFVYCPMSFKFGVALWGCAVLVLTAGAGAVYMKKRKHLNHAA